MASKSLFRREFSRLRSLKGRTPQQRGYDLEDFLYRLALSEGLSTSPAYRTSGEQIDAMIQIDGRFILVEVKWVALPVPASDVYAFRSKVDGKLSGTVGLFVAVNGFAQDVPDALRYGKEVNVILADGDDLGYALEGAHTWAGVVRVKLRRAAQYGEVLYNYRRVLDEQAIED